jgi:hypothetical protein
MDYVVSIHLYLIQSIMFCIDKNLNETCVSSSECWSGDCRDAVCKCPLGFIPKGDNSRCSMLIIF